MGRTLADGYLELRLDSSKLDEDTKKAFKQIGFKQQGVRSGQEAGEGLASGLKSKLGALKGSALGALGLGAGIGAAVTSGLTAALDVGKANDKLRAQLNLTKQESAKLGTAAGQLYAKGYGESIGDVNNAIRGVIQAVPSLRTASVPVLKDIASGALDVARVFDQDIGRTTAAVSSLMKSGLAPNAKVALDVIAKGFQTGADKGEDLLDTFVEYSVQFKKVGLDAPASLGVINQLLAGGARNADTAADAVKEFSIRSIDGSKASVKGYQLLGLNAGATAAAIAKGGPSAKAAFGQVVTALNAMKDPVQRNTAGVALFGTKFEDLGNSFRNLDVGKATAQLGAVGGAARSLVAQSDSSKIQSFVRTLQTGFVSIIGGEVIPAIQRFGAANRTQIQGGLDAAARIGRDILLPALRAVGGFLVGTVVPALVSTAKFVGENAGAFKVAAVAVGAFYAVHKIGAAIMAVQAAGGLLAFLRGLTLVSSATKVAAGIQAAFNFVLSANPIGLVVVAIGALVAAIVVAYRNSDTFRKVVQAAWGGIKTAVKATVDFLMNTVWPNIRAIWKGIADGAMWLWRNAIMPAWNGIRTAISTVVGVVRVLWSGLSTSIKAVWTGVLKPVFDTLTSVIREKIPAGFKAGVAAIGRVWAGLQAIARKPVEFVVREIVNPFISGINTAAGAVGIDKRIPLIPGFAAGGTVGGRLSGAPSSVDNRMAPATIPGVGAVKLAGGEFVVNARDTARALPILRWINDGMRGGPGRIGARIGRRLTDYPGDGSEGFAFAKGGLVGWVKDVWSAVTNPADTIRKPFESALRTIPGGGMIREFLIGAGRKLLTGATSWLTGGLMGDGAGGKLSGNVGKAAAFIRAQSGKPYVWASAGPRGYDCSGIVSAAWNIIKGRSPYSHTFSTGSLPGPFFSPGKVGPLMAGWSHPGQAPASASVGHMAGRIGGLPFESRGSRGVVVGRDARPINSFAQVGAARFASGGQVPVFDRGGTLMPGFNTVFNGTGAPEPLVRPTGAGGGEVHFHFHGPVASKQAAKAMVLSAFNELTTERKINIRGAR